MGASDTWLSDARGVHEPRPGGARARPWRGDHRSRRLFHKMSGARHDIEFSTRNPVLDRRPRPVDAAFRAKGSRAGRPSRRVATVRRDFDTGARNMVFFADPDRSALMPHHATLTHFPALSLTIMRFGLAGTLLALASCGASTPRARVKRAATGSTTAAFRDARTRRSPSRRRPPPMPPLRCSAGRSPRLRNRQTSLPSGDL